MEKQETTDQSSVDSKETEEVKNVCSEDSKETDVSSEKSCGEGSKIKSPMPIQNTGYLKSLLLRICQIWPLKYVFKMLKKIAVFAGLSEVETIGSAEATTPNRRRYLSGKKRIGRLARLVLLVTPYRIQCLLGFRTAESIGNTSADDIRKSPLKLHGKGSKRKQGDLEMEEQHSWVAFMNDDLPDEDQDDDPTYEPSNSESDSEENKSKNDTESDLEVEEKDGVMMLKETTSDDTQDDKEQTNASESEEPNPDSEEQNDPTSTGTRQIMDPELHIVNAQFMAQLNGSVIPS
ncbi:uncharacterized protein LOC142743425 [Rhinoderma darwinii]|uniref:uncharacterized protein LOC142743425 n=1 Tax=Rhinoderma darwinii TaxID=43563 RepID=UPI003F673BD5